MGDHCEKHGPYSVFCRSCDIETLEANGMPYGGTPTQPNPGEVLTGESDLYARAVVFATRDRPSPSYLQRRLQIGFKRAVSLIERMEAEGLISKANSAGQRTILVPFRLSRPAPDAENESLDALLRRAADTMKAWTPEQREAHFEAQKRAWVAAEMAFGDEGTRIVQTPMHRDPAKATEALGIPRTLPMPPYRFQQEDLSGGSAWGGSTRPTDTPLPAAPDDGGLEAVRWVVSADFSEGNGGISADHKSPEAAEAHLDRLKSSGVCINITSEPLVTLAQALAAIAAERAKVSDLQGQMARLQDAKDKNDDAFCDERFARLAAEARAEGCREALVWIAGGYATCDGFEDAQLIATKALTAHQTAEQPE